MTEQQIKKTVADFVDTMLYVDEDNPQNPGRSGWLWICHEYISWSRTKGYPDPSDIHRYHLRRALIDKYGEPEWPMVRSRKVA